MKRFGKGCLIIVGIVVLVGIVSAMLGGGKRNQAALSDSASVPTAAVPNRSAPAAIAVASTDAPAAVQPTVAPKVGQDVQVDEVRWKVLEASDLGKTLKSDNQFSKDMTTSGRFIRVRLEVENTSKDMLSFTGIDLQDDQGRTFKRSSDALMLIPSEQQCVLENLNPNIVKSCTLVYEVPQNAAHLQALVGDLKLLGSSTALIDLGL